jgi:hypothetical protein
MINHLSTEIVARCIPLAAQPATINQNSATISATINATNSLKALASVVLERNKQCNYNATDALKPTQLLPEKCSDKVALIAPPLQGILTENDKQKISAWVRSLGGSEETIAEELTDCLGQCRNDPEALAYFLKRAEEVGAISTPIALVQCGNCNSFEPYHEHGKGSGFCNAGVQSAGLYHWSETKHQCAEFSAIINKSR